MGFIQTEIKGIPCWKHSDLTGVTHGFLGAGLDAKTLDGSKLPEIPEISSISLLTQVHGIEIVTPDSSECKADGFLVRKGEGACGIKTADCVPLLLINREHTLAALLHCGWKGTVDGIVTEAISKFREEYVHPEDIFAYAGPAAQVCCYEIGEDVAEQFLNAIPEDISPGESPIENRNGIFYGSVARIIKGQLSSLSVKLNQVHVLQECTICGGEYYSHRRGSEERQLSYVSI